jgi:hypothetical protein
MVKNINGQNVKRDKRSTGKMSNGKKHRKDKTLNGWQQRHKNEGNERRTRQNVEK